MSSANDTESFFLNVNGQVYGPYSRASVSQYLEEGRINAGSLIATEASGAYRPIKDMISFAGALRELQARRTPRARAAEQRAESGAHAQTELANIVIVTDIRSAAAQDFEARLAALGRAARLFGSVFILRTPHSAAQLRHSLSQILQNGDRFFLVDATRERLAWFNLGPEIDAHVRQVWGRPLDESQH